MATAVLPGACLGKPKAEASEYNAAPGGVVKHLTLCRRLGERALVLVPPSDDEALSSGLEGRIEHESVIGERTL